MKKMNALFFAAIFTAVSLTACGSDKNTKTDSADNTVNTTTNTAAYTTALSNGDNKAVSGTNSSVPTNKVSDKTEWKVYLYFPDKNSQYVEKSEKGIKVSNNSDELTTAEKARICLEELINGENTAMPKGTKVLSVVQDNDMLKVNFSKEFDVNMNGGSTAINMMMSQIVLTLTELDDVKQVSITIDGKVIDEYKGHIELNRPFKRSEFIDFIEKDK